MSGFKLLPSLIVAVFAVTIAFFSPPETGAADERRIVIEILNFEFAPEMPAVAVGDVVVWVNHDIVPHTVTATDESWDSGLIEAGIEWKMLVTAGMIEEYYCQFHPTMIASLEVGTG